MGRKYVAMATVLAVAATAGCSLLSPDVPKCSDAQTLDLVRQVIAENLGEKGAESLPIEKLRAVLGIELPHATLLEENIKKYTCQATVKAVDGQGGQHSIDIEYSSQLDDNNQHLVHVGGVNALDQLILSGVVNAALKASPAPSVSESAVAAPAPAVAEAAEAVPEETVANHTPEEIAENARIREAIFSGADGNPKLGDYPVEELYTGPTAELDKSSEDAKTFRTRLSEALRDGEVEFGGEYTTAGWGCGTSCYSMMFINKRTGKVMKQSFGGESGPYVMKMDPKSTLVVAEGAELDDNYESTGNFAYFYALQDGELSLIKQVPLPEALEEVN